MSKLLALFLKNETGTTAIEYGLIAALLGVAIMVGGGALGNALSDQWVQIATTMENVTQ